MSQGIREAVTVVAERSVLVHVHLPGRYADERPVDVFAELDGHWKGTFVGLDSQGRELYRIRVSQHYETVDAHTQRVRVTDTMPDGKVIRGEGENTAKRLADGTLQLRCVVRKSTGETVVHDGRLFEGVDGGTQIVWYSSTPDRVETFREGVRHEGSDIVYSIHGMGRYGDQLMLMNGRYLKQPTRESAEKKKP